MASVSRARQDVGEGFHGPFGQGHAGRQGGVEMAVGVDVPGHDGAALQVDDFFTVGRLETGPAFDDPVVGNPQIGGFHPGFGLGVHVHGEVVEHVSVFQQQSTHCVPPASRIVHGVRGGLPTVEEI